MTDPTAASYVATRPVGDATVTFISDATGLSTIILDDHQCSIPSCTTS